VVPPQLINWSDAPDQRQISSYLQRHQNPYADTSHRLRHTYGTELAAAGIDLLVLRELMGHVSTETTAGYIHLSAAALAAEYAAARARIEAPIEASC
jgi:site-specific recombinase XerD